MKARLGIVLISLISIFIFYVSPLNAGLPPLELQDEGTSQGVGVSQINCVGAGISCTKSGRKGTLTVSGGGGAPTDAKYIVAQSDSTLSAEIAPSTDDQVIVSDSSTSATWRTLPDSDGATQKLQYDQATNTFSAGTDDDIPEVGDFTNLIKNTWEWKATALSTEKPQAAGWDGIAPNDLVTGTNTEALTVTFVDTDDTNRSVEFTMPNDISSFTNANFEWRWHAKVATTGNVIWGICESDGGEGVSWDQACSSQLAAADAVQGTVRQETLTTLQVSLSTLGWTANETIKLYPYRDGDHASDSMTDSAQLKVFKIWLS